MAFLGAALAAVAALVGIASLVACGDEGDAALAAHGDPPDPATAASRSTPALPRNRTAPAERSVNAPPLVVAVRFEPEIPAGGDSVSAVVEVDDPDGDNVWIDYAWSLDGDPVEGANTARLLLRGARTGARLEVAVIASDGKDRSEPFRADTEVANAIPQLGAIRVEPEVIVAGDQPIVVRPEATDADDDPIRFEYAWKVNGRAVDETSASLATQGLRRGDRVAVTVRATDGKNASEARELPQLRVANAAPRITSAPGAQAAAGGPFYQITAEDPDGDPMLQFALEGGPAGMTVDASTGAITWQPTPDQVGTHTIAVVVDDRRGGRSRQTIEVTVGEPVGAAPPPARSR